MKYIADLGTSHIEERGDNFITIDRYIVCNDNSRPRVVDSGNDLTVLLEKHGLKRTHVFNLSSFVKWQTVEET